MRPLAALLLLFVLVAPAAGQEDSSTRERLEVLRDDGGDGLVDPPPTEHLGWGTLEDVFVDLGAGAAVSTLSGNLVVHLEPVARPSVPVGLRMALTYNHQDRLGASDLGPGWSWDLGRFVAAGAWGDRLFIDGDGFRDSFWAGPPPTMEELGRVADDVVARWRQDTPATERRRLGGVRALRELLASDPATLGAMRLRYLGPPTMEDGDPTTFRSFARGGRTLESTDDGPVLQQVDGTVETYGKTGLLQQVAPPMGAPWDFDYTGGRLTSVSSSGRTEWEINRDSRGRIIDFDTPAGGRASIDYLGPLVRSITGSMGTWRFGYDERSRVTSVDGPGGSVRVRYDGDGRVQAASGPLRSVEFGAGADAEAFVVDVRGLAAGPMAVRWEPDARRRTVERGGAVVDKVTFAPRAALPIRIDRDGSPVAVAWSEAGELVGIGRGDVDVTWERGADGALERVDASGQIASISRETERRLTWMDPSTRATTLERDQAGRLRWLRDRDVDLGVHWSGAGGLSGVRLPGGIMVGLPLDGARVGSLEWGGVRSGVRRDEQGRITAIVRQDRNDAHRLVEECMLAANRSAALWLREKRGTDRALYNGHAGFREERLESIGKLVDHALPEYSDVSVQELDGYRRVLSAASKADGPLPLRSIMARMLQPGELSAEPRPHFGLGFDCYSTFTSPLRKYNDLVVQRCIRACLDNSSGGDLSDDAIAQLQEKLRNVRQASRQMEQWLQYQYLAKQPSEQTYAGHIAHLNGGGFTVELHDSGISGFVEARSIPEKLSFDADTLRLYNDQQNYQLEQAVTVKVAEIDPFQRKLLFTLA